MHLFSLSKLSDEENGCVKQKCISSINAGVRSYLLAFVIKFNPYGRCLSVYLLVKKGSYYDNLVLFMHQ